MNFKFKGNRKYVHGPDIYYAICDYITGKESGTPKSIKLVSKHLSDHQLFFTDNILEEKEIQSFANYTIEGENKRLYSYQSNVPVTESFEYEEPDIVKNATFFDKESVIVNYTKYNIAEVSVALLKEICNRSISNLVKWVFVGLELEVSTERYTGNEIKVEMIKNLGTKMVISDIYIDSIKVGQLKFSSLPK